MLHKGLIESSLETVSWGIKGCCVGATHSPRGLVCIWGARASAVEGVRKSR